jgi:hypothetical protein
VGRVDLRSGNVDRKFLFEPDYDANLAPRAKTGMVEGVGETSQAPLRFDGAQFYATVGNNVYRYVFAEPGSHIRYWSRATRGSSGARYVARYSSGAATESGRCGPRAAQYALVSWRGPLPKL